MNVPISIKALARRRLCQSSLRCQIRAPSALPRQSIPSARCFTTSRPRSLISLRQARGTSGGKDLNRNQRVAIAAAGLTTTLLATYLLLTNSDVQLDSPPTVPEFNTSLIPPLADDHPIEKISTGTSTIPTFPKTIRLPTSQSPERPNNVRPAEEEYQLIGLGIRTVSFLSIQVYVVGLYIAVSDIAVLQERLVRLVDPVATALVQGEREKLRDMLMDPENGEEIWGEVLKHEGLRTALRIVPTRNTDFMHLRDGWVRGITGRTQRSSQAGNKEYEDESFGEAVREFKGMFGGGARKNVPKGQTLLLMRDTKGAMNAWYNEEGKPMMQLGGVQDERISRLVWLGYLAGKNVASEGARKSVVGGIMEFVERPVGTVATQVV